MKNTTKNIREWAARLFRKPIAWIWPSSRTEVSGRVSQSLMGHLFRQHWMVAMGLAVAIFAFWATQQYAEDKVAQERDRMLPKGGLIEVLVAARDLAAGDLANATNVAVRKVPREWSLPGALSPLDFDAINQLTVLKPLAAGNPLTLEHLRTAKPAPSSLALEPGFRAVSIAVDEVSSVGGLIQPGDRVDLWGHAATMPVSEAGALVSLSVDRPAPTKPARLVAENLKVLAIGGRTDRLEVSGGSAAASANGSYSSITLAVPGPIAATVLGGQFQGRLGIALRGPVDMASKPARPTPAATKLTSTQQVIAPIEILVGGIEGGSL